MEHNRVIVENFWQESRAYGGDMRASILGSLTLRTGGYMDIADLEEEVEANFVDTHGMLAFQVTDFGAHMRDLLDCDKIQVTDKRFYQA